ncbi:MAG TPA: single-stranded DNA-binding protein [Plantibacter sp.]|uniref:single-stranded DNA-binding protein n=1 Tax=unclassified Plantibacter TaxID=2624265 RepID=UPI002C94E79F|nr:single-stranded DNA-binding protein [Plantibacter sp.]
MNDQITVRGHVATDPKHHRTTSGLDITSFRLASQQRRYDAKQGAWVAQDTNWYTVSAFRGLATAATESLVKGQRVVVVGRLRIRDWESGERRGTSIDIEADGIGSEIDWQPKPTAGVETAVHQGQDTERRPPGLPVAPNTAAWGAAPLQDPPPHDTPF